MADQRDKILQLKTKYLSLVRELNGMAASLQQTECRYRRIDGKCGHSRHNMKKYPQHQPVPPPCGPDVCPRN